MRARTRMSVSADLCNVVPWYNSCDTHPGLGWTLQRQAFTKPVALRAEFAVRTCPVSGASVAFCVAQVSFVMASEEYFDSSAAMQAHIARALGDLPYQSHFLLRGQNYQPR